RFTRLPEDAAIGTVLSVFFGFGLVLLSHIQGLDTGDQGGISKFIYGQTAAMRVADAVSIGIAALIVGLIATALFKEFRLVCFDPEFAGTQGWPVSVVDLLMMTLVVIVTVIGLQAVGLILIVALVIIPPAAARFWSERLWVVTATAAVIGGLSGYLGAAASALFPKFPAGGIIVLVAGALFLLSLLFAPERGVLFAVVRHVALRIEVAQQHVLRALFEAEETGRVEAENFVPLADLERERRWSGVWLEFVVRSLMLRRMTERRDERLRLTRSGRRDARRITRNHRLWEQFLVAYADLAPSHVDRSADFVEHVLSPEMVAELERQLAEIDRLPAPAMPVSVHPLEARPGRSQEATS
ncbi:MAG: metal ABC transporter permease, partial [Rhodospirillales bacterium]|nr:metal ABC transporter permease [Rhodospirillales bacterium]